MLARVTMGVVTPPCASPGVLLRHVRTGRAHSRAELVALTGASRSTVSARVDQLLSARLLEEGGTGWSTGGRPPTLLRFNSRAGCVLAVDLGVTSVDVAVTDLSAQVLATVGHEIDIAEGPEAVLGEVDRLAQQVLGEAGCSPPTCGPSASASPGRWSSRPGGPSTRRSCPAGTTSPSPARSPGTSARSTSTTTSTSWRWARSASAARTRTCSSSRSAPASAAGSSSRPGLPRRPGQRRRHRPHLGAPPDGRTVVCRCGNENCLEAVAGGAALVRDAVAAGCRSAPRARWSSSRRAARRGAELVRNAGRRIGTVLASLVNFFNPHRIVMTGGVARAGAPCWPASARRCTAGRCRWPPARSRSRVSDAPELSGRLGAALMAVEGYLDEDAVAGPRTLRPSGAHRVAGSPRRLPRGAGTPADPGPPADAPPGRTGAVQTWWTAPHPRRPLGGPARRGPPPFVSIR